MLLFITYIQLNIMLSYVLTRFLLFNTKRKGILMEHGTVTYPVFFSFFKHYWIMAVFHLRCIITSATWVSSKSWSPHWIRFNFTIVPQIPLKGIKLLFLRTTCVRVMTDFWQGGQLEHLNCVWSIATLKQSRTFCFYIFSAVDEEQNQTSVLLTDVLDWQWAAADFLTEQIFVLNFDHFAL